MTHKEFMEKCIDDCKRNGEILTSGAAELLMEKFAQHMDEAGGGSGGGKKLILKYDGETFKPNMTYDEVMTAIKNGELTGSEFIFEAYYPADDEYPEGAMFEPSPMIIRSYMDGENPQFMLGYNYFTGNGFTFEKCYMGAWGVSRHPDGANEV